MAVIFGVFWAQSTQKRVMLLFNIRGTSYLSLKHIVRRF